MQDELDQQLNLCKSDLFECRVRFTEKVFYALQQNDDTEAQYINWRIVVYERCGNAAHEPYKCEALLFKEYAQIAKELYNKIRA